MTDQARIKPLGKLAIAALGDVRDWEHRGGFPEYWRQKTLPKLRDAGLIHGKQGSAGIKYFLTDAGRGALAAIEAANV